MILSLPIPVSANRYWRSYVIKGRSQVVLSAEAKAYKQEVALRARLAGIRHPIVGRVSLTFKLYPARPKDTEERIRKLGAVWDTDVQCLDVDNIFKCAVDSLKGVAYIDDKQVWDIRATRMPPEGAGRVDVEINEIHVSSMPTADQFQLTSTDLPAGALAACYGKQSFESEALARAVANRRKRGHTYEHYRCKECGKWHVGNHTGYVQTKKSSVKTAKPKAVRDE